MRTALGAEVSCPRAQDTGSLPLFGIVAIVWITVGPPPVRLARNLIHAYHGKTEKHSYASRTKAPRGFVRSIPLPGAGSPSGDGKTARNHRVPRVPHTAKIASAEA